MRKFSPVFPFLVLFSALLLGSSSCVDEPSFEWSQIKFQESTLEIKVDQPYELCLFGAPESFRVDWRSEDPEIVSIVNTYAETVEFEGETQFLNRAILKGMAPGRTVLMAKVTCPKGVVKEFPLDVKVSE